MAYLFAAVFFLYETRLSFGREKWRPYIAFGFISATICAYSSIPSLIFYVVKREVTQNSIYELVLTFALFIFISSRLLLVSRLTEDRNSSTVIAISLASEARAEELYPVPKENDITEITGDPIEDEEKLQIPDENQITIEELGEIIPNEEQSENEFEAQTEEEEK